MMLREDKGFSDHNLHEIMTAPPITREQSAQLLARPTSTAGLQK